MPSPRRPRAEAAARQGRFWDMHELLFRRQKALEDGDLRGYAAQLGLDVAAFDRDRAGAAVADRIRRDVGSGLTSGRIWHPTLFINGVVHRGGLRPARPAGRAGRTREPGWTRNWTGDHPPGDHSTGDD